MSCVALKFLPLDCSSRHNLDMIVSISSNNIRSSTLLGSKRSDWYLLISGLGLATSTCLGLLKSPRTFLNISCMLHHVIASLWQQPYNQMKCFQLGLSNFKHYNEMISRVLVAICQVLWAKKTDQWGVWNKEPICATCNWHTCCEKICEKFFFGDLMFLPTLNLSNLSNKNLVFRGSLSCSFKIFTSTSRRTADFLDGTSDKARYSITNSWLSSL